MNIELNKEKESLCCICCICLEKINDNNVNTITTLIDCKHVFHNKCINKWFEYRKYTCPYCRNKISGVRRCTTKVLLNKL